MSPTSSQGAANNLWGQFRAKTAVSTKRCAKALILEDRDEYTSEGVFWIPEGNRWEDLRKAAKQPDIGARIDAAMDAIEKENPTLKGVLPKSFSRRELTPSNAGWPRNRHLL